MHLKKRRFEGDRDVENASSECMTREEYERLEDARRVVEELERARRTIEEFEGRTTPLWRLFREALGEGEECKDIVEKLVLPKLSTTDVKFFYDVSTETRAVIKRSSRTDALEKAFQVEEMSSISTLEFAWENRSLWVGRLKREPDFCWKVAETKKLELLKWIREVKKCEWDETTISMAARQGNLEMVKYCVANECPMGEHACAYAAGNGSLECLKYLHEEVKAPLDWVTAFSAANHGHLHILEYLVERKYDEYNEHVCMVAAEEGHLDCLKYLHEVAKAPWGWGTASAAAQNGHLHILEYLVEQNYDKLDEQTCSNAALNGHLDCLKYLREVAKAPWNSRAVEETHGHGRLKCLQYLLDNGWPLPDGWEYENGTLHVPQQDA